MVMGEKEARRIINKASSRVVDRNLISRENIMKPLKPKQKHKAIGERSEAIIMAKLLEAGYGVLKPSGNNLRYDLVIEDADGQLWRIQCKAGWIEGDDAYTEFATASTYYHTRAGRTGYGRKDYQGQIDYLLYIAPVRARYILCL